MTKSASAVLVGGLVMAGSFALAACSSSLSINTTDVQESISKGLTQQAGGSFTVTCPSQAPAQKDATFTCSVEDRTDGSTRTVTVTEVDDKGGFTWKVEPLAGASAKASATPAPSAS